MAASLFDLTGNKSNAPRGCAARGGEISCFATPLAREEFASELFICYGGRNGKMDAGCQEGRF